MLKIRRDMLQCASEQTATMIRVSSLSIAAQSSATVDRCLLYPCFINPAWARGLGSVPFLRDLLPYEVWNGR